MDNVFDVLKERGFIDDVTDEEGVRDALASPVTCYIGFDPTAKSFHVGSLLPIMGLLHMQRGGHRPIALVGGGTGLVGDPSGKTEMRQIMTVDEVAENADALKGQLARFLDFGEGGALLLNNADWLVDLRYIDFLRDIGRHFSVNRMLTAESYRMRLETGLSFIEFNYMLLQAYDFLHLYENFGCTIQMGGSDQWGNIVAGVDLVRRMTSGRAFGITFPLITTFGGQKMGKTAAGAVWLDPELTTPYDYFQYWVNSDDMDVARFLKYFTLLPIEEIEKVERLEGAQMNAAKSVLAFEVTSLTHGEAEARAALDASFRQFGPREITPDLLPTSGIHIALEKAGELDEALPTTEVPEDDLAAGMKVVDLFDLTGLTSSKSEARRLIAQGGAYVNDERVPSADHTVTTDDLKEGEVILRAGKKKYHRVKVR